MNKIPFFNYPYLYKSNKKKFDEINMMFVLESIYLQKDLDEFEEGIKISLSL